MVREPTAPLAELKRYGIETRTDLPVDLRITLSFALPGDHDPIVVIGRVARRIGAGSAPSGLAGGLGLEFDAYGEPERVKLEAFLHRALAG